MLKSLHRLCDQDELKQRLSCLSEDASPRWGRMNATQMLKHCRLVLEIPLGKVTVPAPPRIIRFIGIVTKNEMKLFKNGIPRNMPTFAELRAYECANFESEMVELLHTLDQYCEFADAEKLPDLHPLFGKMQPKDWGFLEYKHLHHHLKQFGL